MPFGLVNAPAVFHQYINEVLRQALDRYVFVYLDNILIYSQTVDKHVRRILQLLLENHHFVKLEKSTFHARAIFFLGFVVSHNKLCMDPVKMRVIENWPRPTLVRQVQRFLGFTAFYCRFEVNFSSVEAPLTVLTRKASGWFCWPIKAQQALEKIKHHLIVALILQLSDVELPFIIEVDASEVGVGAVLSQRSGKYKKLHPCAYFSRCLSPAEKNYDVGDRKLLAVKLALEE
ncbi:hypothetical protein P4O66_001314 [Electrophorus voltai]|uniref:ribonuclease H n=1 Tax=Electrophorus voltai TaxID=2609070 RepID=A0AAD8Z8I9_9TELE|nr:hypothetical protein P4O66_001314 [Electrophorus voltai]